MRVPHYLTVSRHDIYYLRFPIPRQLHPEGKPSGIKVSLETRNLRHAIYKGQQLFYLGRQLIIQLALQGMNYTEIKNALQELFSAKLVAAKARLDANGPLEAYQRQVNETTRHLCIDEPSSILGGNVVGRLIDAYNLPIETGTRSYQIMEEEFPRHYAAYLDQLHKYDDQIKEINFDSQIENKSKPVVREDTYSLFRRRAGCRC